MKTTTFLKTLLDLEEKTTKTREEKKTRGTGEKKKTIFIKELENNRKENIEKKLFKKISLFGETTTKQELYNKLEELKAQEKKGIKRKQERELIDFIETGRVQNEKELENFYHYLKVVNLIEKNKINDFELSLEIEQELTRYILKNEGGDFQDLNEFFLLSHSLKRLEKVEQKKEELYNGEATGRNTFGNLEEKLKSESKIIEKLSNKMILEEIGEENKKELEEIKKGLEEIEKEKSEHKRKIFEKKEELKRTVKTIEEKTKGKEEIKEEEIKEEIKEELEKITTLKEEIKEEEKTFQYKRQNISNKTKKIKDMIKEKYTYLED